MKKRKLTNEEIITHLFKKNGKEYNLHKASEECQELALVLTQRLLKGDKIPDQEIIDEIGDVLLRISILLKMFDKKSVEKRMAFKLSKYREYIDSARYKTI